MADTFRVLVTGSRTWDDGPTVWRALESVRLGGRTLVVVHGGADGADDLADRWARAHGAHGAITREVHRADWQRHHKRAGFIRNAEMVSLGADLCLAFVMPCSDGRCLRAGPHGSHGATNCVGLAEQAGIPMRRFGYQEGGPARDIAATQDSETAT